MALWPRKNPEAIERAPAEPCATGRPHHWVLPAGESTGTCKRCGADRAFTTQHYSTSRPETTVRRHAGEAPLARRMPRPISDDFTDRGQG